MCYHCKVIILVFGKMMEMRFLCDSGWWFHFMHLFRHGRVKMHSTLLF